VDKRKQRMIEKTEEQREEEEKLRTKELFLKCLHVGVVQKKKKNSHEIDLYPNWN
jgi:hypothetical protein